MGKKQKDHFLHPASQHLPHPAEATQIPHDYVFIVIQLVIELDDK